MTTSHSAMTGAKADAIEMLMTDHREVEQLFHQYEAATNNPGVAHHAAEDIIRKLSIHAAVEEQILYPAIARELIGGDEMASHAIDEHQEVK